MPRKVSDLRQLFALASVQGGYFTAQQARQAGYSPRNLVYHAATGRFERISRGFYRIPEFPASPFEDVVAAWLKAGPDRAVVSHETALVLHELSSIRPAKIHLTVPRRARPPGNRPRLPSLQLHTTTRPFRRQEVVQRHGVRVTSPTRTIVDVAEVGTDPAHVIESAVEGIGRGLLVARELRDAAAERSARVQQVIARAIDEAEHAAPVR